MTGSSEYQSPAVTPPQNLPHSSSSSPLSPHPTVTPAPMTSSQPIQTLAPTSTHTSAPSPTPLSTDPSQTRKHPYKKKARTPQSAVRNAMRTPSQRKNPPAAKYMFFPRANVALPTGEVEPVDMIRCNIWQRDHIAQTRWGSIQTGWIKPPPDALATDSCRRTDIVCALGGKEQVVASIFWRNGFLSSVSIMSRDAILHREEYKHTMQALPVGFSWPDGHRFFTWTPVDGKEGDVTGIVRNGNTCATVHSTPGYVVLAPVYASYEKVEIMLLGVILGRYKRGMLTVERKDDVEFEQGGLVWADTA